jgi:hypothetical protein
MLDRFRYIALHCASSHKGAIEMIHFPQAPIVFWEIVRRLLLLMGA